MLLRSATVWILAMSDRRVSGALGAALILATMLGFSSAAQAQAPILKAQANPAAKPEMKAEFCPGFVAGGKPRVIPAALSADQARITFIGHATFLIESPKLVRIATDYNDYVRPPIVPDIATMNHAHTTHYTERPDPAIKHLLRGWRDDGKPAGWDVTYQDVRVRSIATNIRDWNGGTQRNGNSIFVFEIGNLCIAHLGHLHHTLTQSQLDEIGRIDVVMVPVDGSWTMDLEGMAEVLQALKAQLMIPMHYFSMGTLNRFLDRVRDKYEVEMHDTPSIVVSRALLPPKPKFLVLPGR
jgi:L-ascorbate metabolism protein UlaG (beta-lactamase superfamily)